MAKDWVWFQGHQREEGAAMGDDLGEDSVSAIN